MKTACIIVNYNDADTTIAQIKRIRDYRSLDAVVVVDNASTDDSLSFLCEVEQVFPMTVLRNRRNETFSKACNQGAEAANEVGKAQGQQRLHIPAVPIHNGVFHLIGRRVEV